MIIKTDGIVLKSNDYGEADKIIHILTPVYGKISVLAMGAKKTKSKCSATTQPLVLGSFVLYKKDVALGRLNQSDIIRSHPLIRNDLLLSTYAMYLADLTYRVTLEHETDQEIYDLIVGVMSMMDSGIYDAEILVRIYEIKLFALRGYRPQLDACIHCNYVDTSYSYRFSISLGGFICYHCFSEDKHAIPVSAPVAKLLKVFQYIDIEKIGKISIKESTREELSKITKRFIEHYFGLQLKWYKVIADIKKMYEL